MNARKKTFFLILLPLLCTGFAMSGTVDTVDIYSQSMRKNIRCVVIKPDIYKFKITKFPVVYLLHGYDGCYSNWIRKAPALKDYADQYETMIVCPDGAAGSWYFDSPVDPSYRYETHIVFEVVSYIDSHYKSLADRRYRAITGLSMGGHGALFLALRHPDIFGAAGSMSGGFDLNELKRKFDVYKRVGDTLTHAAEWHDLSVINLLDRCANTPVKIIFDCGVNDMFIEANRRTHQKMLQLKIPHVYSEKPGGHSWDYWTSSLPGHLLFFHDFFRKSP
ncbi:MAG: esterase family protein [Chitinophagaceae bacterium]|nr:esterase family protein [Chitinophagaceae bacterium]